MNELRTIRLLLPMLRGHRWALPLVILLGVAAALAEGVGISLFIPLLHTVTRDGDGADTSWLARVFDDIFGGVAPDDRLLAVSIAILAVVVVRAVLLFSSEALFAWLEARVGHELRTKFFDHLMLVDYSYIERTDTGRMLNALSNETWTTTDTLAWLVKLVISLATVVIYTVLLLAISWELTLVVMSTMVAVALIVRFVTRRSDELSTELTRENGNLAIRMLEGCSGAKVIRLFGREDYERQRFADSSWTVSRISRRMATARAAVAPTYELLAGAVLVGVLYISLRGDPAALPSLLVFIVVLYRLQPRVREFDSMRVELVQAGGAVREVARMMDPVGKPFTTGGTVDAASLEPSFTFDHVSFRYGPDDRLALDDVTLEIPAGMTTALVGPSGAGKSTLIDMLVRFQHPDEGTITFGGVPIADVDVASLRRRIAMVSQDIYLFNTTARENIAYGNLDCDDDAIERAARLAHAAEFIEQLPRGYDTMLGDDGVRLSGGQRQRLALARAIIRDPDVLVLDEATNALDSISENIIQEALDLLSHGRTVIVVAHRLSTVADADQIVVLDRGRLAEVGRLDELLGRDGMFARLHRLQGQSIPEGGRR